MASYELFGASDPEAGVHAGGIAWLMALRNHFERSVWLNPDPVSGWNDYTVSAIRQVFPMFPLSIDGIGGAVRELSARRTA